LTNLSTILKNHSLLGIYLYELFTLFLCEELNFEVCPSIVDIPFMFCFWTYSKREWRQTWWICGKEFQWLSYS